MSVWRRVYDAACGNVAEQERQMSESAHQPACAQGELLQLARQIETEVVRVFLRSTRTPQARACATLERPLHDNSRFSLKWRRWFTSGISIYNNGQWFYGYTHYASGGDIHCQISCKRDRRGINANGELCSIQLVDYVEDARRRLARFMAEHDIPLIE